MSRQKVERKHSLSHVQGEVSPGYGEWAVKNATLKFQKGESEKQEHVKARAKKPQTHPPDATGFSAQIQKLVGD